MKRIPSEDSKNIEMLMRVSRVILHYLTFSRQEQSWIFRLKRSGLISMESGRLLKPAKYTLKE